MRLLTFNPRLKSDPSTRDRIIAAAFLVSISANAHCWAVNIAPQGTAIIGVNDAVDSDEGTFRENSGTAANINDLDPGTRVDTYGDTAQGVSFVGITWDTPRAEPVRNLVLTLANFLDGGWFGPNGSGPGAGRVLAAADLTAPAVQVTTDGLTWTDAAVSANYLSALTGIAVGGGAVPNPSRGTATFTLAAPVTGITGIRIIGPDGGTASNGFLGVFELVVNADPPAAEDADHDGIEDAWETANGLNITLNDAAADPDSDGLSNLKEYEAQTNPQADDSDADGLKDGPEILTHFSNPLVPDSDADGLNDGAEVNIYGSKPKTADSDGDGLTDSAEVNTHQTNPALADTDADGYSDSEELNSGTDPKSALSFPSNIAPLGTAVMGVSPDVNEAGTLYAQQGVGGMKSINDGNLTTRVDTFNGGGAETASYVGILWPSPRTAAVDRMELTMATFVDGGWFGTNGIDPGGGGPLTATGDPVYLVEPTVQVTTNGGISWTTTPHTSDYLTAFEGHLIGGGGVPNPSSRTASFKLTTPQAGINGIRIIGQEGGTASAGFIGVFELTVKDVSTSGDLDDDGLSNADEITRGTNPSLADTDGDGLKDGAEVNTHLTDPLKADTDSDGFPDGAEVSQSTDPKSAASHLDDLARAGQAIMGTNEASDEIDAGTSYAQQGAAGILSINDGNPTTRVDTFGRADAASFAGILWSVPLANPVIRLELTFATFLDGGWFGPNGSGPGAGGELTAAGDPSYLTEPNVQVTTDGGATWATVPHTSD
ncbi:MAG: hypothetical protein EOP86_20000, partial [Verrucomicrobiaceae bacterium]